VFATIILGFYNLVGHPIEICFSKIYPYYKYESAIVIPGFLITLIYYKLLDPFNLNTASSAILAKCYLSM